MRKYKYNRRRTYDFFWSHSNDRATLFGVSKKYTEMKFTRDYECSIVEHSVKAFCDEVRFVRVFDLANEEKSGIPRR